MAMYSDSHLNVLASTIANTADESVTDPTSLLTSALAKANSRDQITQAMIADILTYLPGDLLFKVDISSMGNSLECRTLFGSSDC